YNLLPQRYYLPSGSLVTGKSLFMPGEGYADGTLYPLSGQPDEASVVTEEEYNRALQLLHWSDSYIKQLPDKPEGAAVEGAEPTAEEPVEIKVEVEKPADAAVETTVEIEDGAEVETAVETEAE